MKTQTQEDERQRIEAIARRYSATGLGPLLNNRGMYEFPVKIDRKAYLHSFGLTPKDYLPFLQELSNGGINIEIEAEILGFSLKDITSASDPRKIPENIEDIDLTFENGDRVVLMGYKNEGRSQEGRFVTGYNPSTRKFAYASEKDHQSHGGLAGKVMHGYEIFEAGFMKILPSKKRISFFGDSDTFRTYPGQISINLLERALTKWHIERSE